MKQQPGLLVHQAHTAVTVMNHVVLAQLEHFNPIRARHHVSRVVVMMMFFVRKMLVMQLPVSVNSQ